MFFGSSISSLAFSTFFSKGLGFVKWWRSTIELLPQPKAATSPGSSSHTVNRALLAQHVSPCLSGGQHNDVLIGFITSLQQLIFLLLHFFEIKHSIGD
jgi:hypothetical protein